MMNRRERIPDGAGKYVLTRDDNELHYQYDRPFYFARLIELYISGTGGSDLTNLVIHSLLQGPQNIPLDE